MAVQLAGGLATGPGAAAVYASRREPKIPRAAGVETLPPTLAWSDRATDALPDHLPTRAEG